MLIEIASKELPMPALKIISFLLGITFALFGYFIRFRGKYNLINGFKADFKQGRKTEEYARRVGTIEFFIGIILLIVCALFFLLPFNGYKKVTPSDYGVFLNISPEESDKLNEYQLVVIEPSQFSASRIESLHNTGKTVYGYLNIGAIEEFRPYYDRFQNLTLADYENWPDERWIDASSPEWQNFIVNEVGKQYADKGIDGLFLDNTDVYYHYQTDSVFEGLCAILKGLKKYDLTLIINGGDTFVSRCIEENIASSLFDGVNQETVFTRIDFTSKTYGQQAEAETTFFQEYLSKVKKCGLSVYLLEYRADRALSKRINTYCLENGFLWYNADGLELR